MKLIATVALTLTALPPLAVAQTPATDTSPHKTQLVTVDDGVALEVLDWGGDGSPLIFLSGLGDTAHVFDTFAPKFTGKHHVYGITRRGFGASNAPPPTEANYSANRLGEDVLFVIKYLQLRKPIIAGHSIAGEELSSVGSRSPKSVAGLIYLDAAFAHAFYDTQGNPTTVDIQLVRRDLENLLRADKEQARKIIQDLRETLPSLTSDLNWYSELLDGPMIPSSPTPDTPKSRISNAIIAGERKFISLNVPILAIVATPKACGSHCEDPSFRALDAAEAKQANAFERGNPSAHVVRIPNAQHYVYKSNADETEREMDKFMDNISN